MVGKYEIYKDKSGKFRWRLTHTNGRVIAKSGEGYSYQGKRTQGHLGCIVYYEQQVEFYSVNIIKCHDNVIFPAAILLLLHRRAF